MCTRTRVRVNVRKFSVDIDFFSAFDCFEGFFNFFSGTVNFRLCKKKVRVCFQERKREKENERKKMLEGQASRAKRNFSCTLPQYTFWMRNVCTKSDR